MSSYGIIRENLTFCQGWYHVCGTILAGEEPNPLDISNF